MIMNTIKGQVKKKDTKWNLQRERQKFNYEKRRRHTLEHN